MSRLGRLSKGRLHTLILGAAFAATWALSSLSMFEPANHALVSMRTRAAPIEASGQFVFVSIDARSLQSLGVWPWPREVYAAVVSSLMEAGATEIYLDLDLSARSTDDGDAALEAALEAAGGSVILPVFRQQSGFGIQLFTRNTPISEFQQHAWLGAITMPVDADGLVRRYPYGERIGDENVPSVAALLSGEFGPPETEFLINFGIDPESVPSVSLIDVLLGHDATDFQGRSVVVGAHAMEVRSPIAVPVHGVLPGPLVHILAAETLDRHLELRWFSAAPGMITVAILGFVLAARGRGHMVLVGATLLGTSAALEILALWAHVQHAVIVPTAVLHKMLLVTGLVVAGRELDLRRFLLHMLRLEKLNAERILERVITDSSDAILIVDEDLCLLRVSDTARKLFDRPDAVGGDALETVVPVEIVDSTRAAIAELRAGRHVRTTSHELTLDGSDGPRHLEYAVTPSRLWKLTDRSQTSEERFVACLSARDVTADRTQRRELDRLARFDALTGALNREEFVARLSSHLAGAGAGSAVIALDLHRFRTINATLGRDVGDRLLVALVRRIDDSGLDVSPVARLSGGRFAVFTAGPATLQEAKAAADRLVELAGAPFDLSGQMARSGVRIGVAPGENEDTAESLLNKAEHALDETRLRNAPDRRVFDHSTFAKQARARQIERDYWTALCEDQLYLAYQPLVHVTDGVLAGAEALARWRHPELGAIPPSEFIAVAENSGFIEHLGRWVLETACRDAMAWPIPLSVSVNVSPIQFRRSDMVADVEFALEQSGLPADRLTLEITESIFLGAIGELDQVLHRLRSLGVSLALDDFGSGFSSFGYLPRLPLDQLKLDRMFVEALATDPYSEAVIRSVVPLCRELDLDLVCEGVETVAQRDMLAALGCSRVQGFLFGRPEPQERFVEMIAGSTRPMVRQAG